MVNVSSDELRKSSEAPSNADGSDQGGPDFLPALRYGGTVSVDTGGGVADITGVMPPFLQIVQKTSDLVNNGFNVGDWVVNKEHLLAKAKMPFDAIVLKFQQYIKEAVSSQDWALGKRPRLFATPKEAAEAGLRCSWGPNNEKPEADYALDMLLLVGKPANSESGLFGISIGGADYAIVRSSFDKTSYKSMKDTFLQAVAFAMNKKPLISGLWEVSDRLYVSKSNQSNTSWNPVFKLRKFIDAAVQEELKTMFGAFLAAPIPTDEASQAAGMPAL